MTTLQKPRQSTPTDGPRGVNLLERPTLNKGTAFTEDERSALGLHGLLPPQVETLDQQVVRAYDELLTSLAEYDAAETLRRAANTSYDAALHSYQHGVGTYTELATEENAVADAERQIEDARADAHTAAAGLAFAMGLNAVTQAP